MSLLQVSPSANNIVRGGSRLLVKFLGDKAYYHFGYLKSFTSTPAVKTGSTYNGMTGSQKRVKTRVTMASITHAFVCMERSARAIQAWLMSDSTSDDIQASAQADTETIANITGEIDGANVLLGVYYPLAKRLVSNVAWAGKVLGTDFVIEEKSGAIAFLTAVTTGNLADNITYDCEQIAGKSFAKFSNLNQVIAAKIVNVYENGELVEQDAIPLGRLLPDKDLSSGDDGSESGKDSELSFKIEQDFDPQLGWGSFALADQG